MIGQNLEWHETQSTEYPELIDRASSKDYVLIRRNIREESRKDEGSDVTYTLYIYEEKFIPLDEWTLYEDIVTNSQDIQTNSEDIIVTQEGIAESYEETSSAITQCEEAIAEVYELIVNV